MPGFNVQTPQFSEYIRNSFIAESKLLLAYSNKRNSVEIFFKSRLCFFMAPCHSLLFGIHGLFDGIKGKISKKPPQQLTIKIHKAALLIFLAPINSLLGLVKPELMVRLLNKYKLFEDSPRLEFKELQSLLQNVKTLRAHPFKSLKEMKEESGKILQDLERLKKRLFLLIGKKQLIILEKFIQDTVKAEILRQSQKENKSTDTCSPNHTNADTDSKKTTNFFNDLPDKVSLKIFSLIDHRDVLLVNKLFYKIGWLAFDPGINSSSMLRGAVKARDIASVKKLLQDERIDPSAKNNYALKKACRKGFTRIVTLLLAHPKVDPGAEDNYAIKFASERGHAKVVRLLLAHEKVDPSSEDNRAIILACRYGHKKVVKLLLAHPKVDPTVDNGSPIKWPCKSGHTEIVRRLLAHGKIVPSVDDNSPIKWASYYGHADIVKMLLTNPQVDPTAESNYSLKWASKNGHVRVVEVLLSPNRVSKTEDNKALELAKEKGHKKIENLFAAYQNITLTDTGDISVKFTCERGYTRITKSMHLKNDLDENKEIKLVSGTESLISPLEYFN